VEDRIAGSPVAETILNVLKAGLATAPFGGGVASLLTDYIPSSRSRRLEDFAAKVAEDLNRLQDQVRSEYLHTDEFAFIFEKCFRGAAENPQEEKLDAFRGILINSAIRRDVTDEEKDYFLNLVNGLSVVHIKLLAFMASPSDYLKSRGIPETDIMGGLSDFLPMAIPGIRAEVIKSAFGYLHTLNLTEYDSSWFDTVAPEGIELLEGSVSNLGCRFIDFCKSPD